MSNGIIKNEISSCGQHPIIRQSRDLETMAIDDLFHWGLPVYDCRMLMTLLFLKYTLPVFPRMSRNGAIYRTLLACYRNAKRIKYFRIFQFSMNLTIKINTWDFIFKIIQLVQKTRSVFDEFKQIISSLWITKRDSETPVNPQITQGLFTGFSKRK